jgi:hypothetical protein
VNDVVIGAVGLTGVTVFLAEGWLNNYQNWIVAKTHGTTYTQQAATTSVFKWVFGLGMVALVLTVAADSEEFSGLAQAFAVVVAGTALFSKGPQATKNLRALVGA